MKKRAILLLIFGVILLAALGYLGYTSKHDDLVFERNNSQVTIDPLTAGITVHDQKGELLETLGSPSAGQEQMGTPLPPAIIYYLLTGKGSISGKVWLDINGNRAVDADEQGIEGIRVYIDNDDSATYTSEEPSQLTDADGLYSILSVKPGTKKVLIDLDTLPASYGITTSHPLAVTVARAQNVLDANFGVQDQAQPAKIDGTIWDRTDNHPIAGARMYVDLNGDDKFSPGEPFNTTDSLGNYLIANIPNGTYKVHLDNGTLDVMYHRTPVQGANPTLVTLAKGSSQTVNLAYVHKASICGTLRDANGRAWSNITVFIDLNANGTYDAGEPTAVTDSSGRYCFDELFAGRYSLLLLANPLWNGYAITPPGEVTLGEGDAFSGIDFLLQAEPVTITGFVWDDENNSRLREPEEKGFGGVEVFLDTNNNGTREEGEPSTVTDTTGAFTFTGLKYGDFSIRVTDANLLKTHVPTTVPSPMFRSIGPGQTFDGARFGYQRKLALVNTPASPTRLTWGNDGNLYVSDNMVGSVFIYDGNLRVQGELKGLSRPLAVRTDNAGNIYVGNQGRQDVEIYDATGTLLLTIGEGQIKAPNDIAFDRENNMYIVDSSRKAVLVYDQAGNYKSEIANSAKIKLPVSVAINYRDDGTGNLIGELYIADQTSCAVQIFTLDGTFKKSAGACGTMYTANWNGLFSGLVAVDIDRDGNINGLDNNLNVVQVFNPTTGAFLRSYNAYLPENENRPNLQTDLSINPADSRVVIGNFETKRIETIATVPTP